MLAALPLHRSRVWILNHGDQVVYLQASRGRCATVLGGNIFRSGDIVEKPDNWSWSEALSLAEDGDTRLAPSDLIRVYDSRSQYHFLKPSPPGAAAPEPDPESFWIARQIIALLEGEELP